MFRNRDSSGWHSLRCRHSQAIGNTAAGDGDDGTRAGWATGRAHSTEGKTCTFRRCFTGKERADDATAWVSRNSSQLPGHAPPASGSVLLLVVRGQHWKTRHNLHRHGTVCHQTAGRKISQQHDTVALQPGTGQTRHNSPAATCQTSSRESHQAAAPVMAQPENICSSSSFINQSTSKPWGHPPVRCPPATFEWPSSPSAAKPTT